MTQAPAFLIPLGLATGFAVGLLYFAALYHGLRLQLGRQHRIRAAMLHLLRPALALAGFGALAQAGAPALLSGLAGFLLARALARRRVAGAAPWT